MPLSFVGKPRMEYLLRVCLCREYHLSNFCFERWWSISMWMSLLILKNDLTFLCSSKDFPRHVPRILLDVIVKLLKVLGLCGLIFGF